MEYEEVINRLKQLSNRNQKDLDGMARFGINVENAWCITVPNIRKLAKEIGKDQDLAVKLWDSEIHEARWLVALVADPANTSEQQAEKWVKDFNSWDICDSMCCNLFDRTSWAYEKAIEWSKRDEEYVKRAGFVIMAGLATHDKEAFDEKFYLFIDRIKEEATDERNFVKKAVNWALRGIGKSRTINLYNLCLKTADEMAKMDSKSARWIAKDAIRELKSDTIIKRLKKKQGGR